MKPSPKPTPAGPLPPTGGARVFGHTADIGLAVRGETLGDLFLWAAVGLARLALKTRVILSQTTRAMSITLPPGPDPEALLVAWLNHLIYLLETEGLAAVGGRLEVGEVGEAGSGWILSGSLTVAQAPPHGVKTGVKAATYHGLKVERKQGLFRARIILDV